jgi:hypothetical protein
VTGRTGGFVYFLQAGEAGPIKIGWALDPLARLNELQVGCPEPLRLLMTLTDEGGLEAQLHRRFARLRLRGEWFRAEQELACLLWLPGLMPPPERPQPTIWGYEHLTDNERNRVRAVRDPQAATELAEELVLVRVMRARPPWVEELATPAA